jgi:hypothetical protein
MLIITSVEVLSTIMLGVMLSKQWMAIIMLTLDDMKGFSSDGDIETS